LTPIVTIIDLHWIALAYIFTLSTKYVLQEIPLLNKFGQKWGTQFHCFGRQQARGLSGKENGQIY
jgi:hypothetical protein